MAQATKTCNECSQDKALTDFTKGRAKCKSCVNAANKIKRDQNKAVNQNKAINPNLVKRCCSCKQILSHAFFSQSLGSGDGLQSACKYCNTLVNCEKSRKEKTVSITSEQYNYILTLPCCWCNTVRAESVDRWDSSLGYTVDNVVPSCILCNSSKSDKHPSVFIPWMRRFNMYYSPQVQFDANFNLTVSPLQLLALESAEDVEDNSKA